MDVRSYYTQTTRPLREPTARGTAKRREIFELNVILYKLQMEFYFALHVICIAGTRMIQKGTDVLFRGQYNDVASCGLSLSGKVPLHLTVRGGEESPVGRLGPRMVELWERVKSDVTFRLVHHRS
jgi:hypothetical protein